ncbi:HNH endonuclease [Aeromonas salmonicida]|uniref:HNH endonuclease n=1 Tax=Aeromonas salmonicida TaxID=645 RepID=UPI00283AA91F|nr:HNH endonuclease [Aeromonas salmonicida]
MVDKRDRIERLLELKNEAKRQEKTSYYGVFSEVSECANLLNSLDPQKRKPWLADVLNEMYVEQNGICPECGLKMSHGDFEVDHKVPHKFGGGNESSNIQLVHPKCNRLKGESVDTSVLLRYLENRAQNL